MKKICFFIISLTFVVSAAVVTKDDPSVTVVGEAKVRATADRVYLVLHVEEDDNVPDSALEQARKDLERTLNAIDRRNVNVSGKKMLNSIIRQDGENSYTAAHSIRISCSPKGDNVFQVINDAGTSYVSLSPPPGMENLLPFMPLIYAVEEYQEIEDELEQEAFEDARARAEKLAQRANKKIGELISIQAGLIPAAGRNLDLPTPYISDNSTGVMMVQTVSASWQLLSEKSLE